MLLLMSFMLQIWMKLMVLMLLMMSNLTIMTMMMILMMIRPGEGGTFFWLASQPAGRPGGSRDPPRRHTQGSGNDGNDGNDDGNGNDGNDEHPDANHPTCPRAQG